MSKQYPVYVPLPTGGGRSDANYTETCHTEANGDRVCKREYEEIGTTGVVALCIVIALIVGFIGYVVWDARRPWRRP